ncbi:MAG: hypothetical protein AAFX05_14665 [Planctomycetota bacterium]
MQNAHVIRRSAGCATSILALALTSHAHAAGVSLYTWSSLDGAGVHPAPGEVHVTSPGTGSYGVAARRIAIGEAGVKEHVSTLRVGWPDPLGLGASPDASMSISLVADTNPNGVGEPTLVGRVTLLKRADTAGLTSYEIRGDFSALGSSTSTMRVYDSLGDLVVVKQLDSASPIRLRGLPPGEPLIREAPIPPSFDADWKDDDSDGDDVFDLDIVTLSLLPHNFSGFEFDDGTVFDVAAARIEFELDGPETELEGVFGYDFLADNLGSFTVFDVPTPGSVVCLGLGACLGLRRRRS